MRAIACIGLFLVVAAEGDADLCAPNDTPIQCAISLREAATSRRRADVPATTAAATREVLESEKAATTGASQGKAFSSTLTNFATLMTGALDYLDVSRDARAITLELRIPAPEALQVRAQAIVRRPILSDALLATAPDEKRALATDELTKQLGDFDDTEANLLIDFSGKKKVRRLAGNIVAGVVRQLADDEPRAQEVQRAMDALNALLTEYGEKRLSEYTAAQRVALETVLTRISATETGLQERWRAIRADSGADRIADLLTNETQLFATAGYHYRNALVGRESLSVKLTWEYGFANLSRFAKEKGTACAEATSGCVSAFSEWYRLHGQQDLQNADRVALSLAYDESPTYAVAYPAYGISVTQDGARSVSGSVKYSRTLIGQGTRTPLRLDLSALYEDVRNDPTRNDRFVATGTITIRVSDDLQVPLGLVYANKPQYLGEVDRKVSAHIGLLVRPPE